GGVYAQRYDPQGQPVGGEFRVNTTTASDQLYPAVAAVAQGNFVVTWMSLNQDGSGWGIYAQRYQASSTNANPVVQSSIPAQSFSVVETISTDVSAYFQDPDGDPLTYTATLSGGSPLPSWLVLDPGTGRFSDFAPVSGDYSITVMATDMNGASAQTD